MKEISGNTRLFGILADPIYHVKTPQRLNEHFARIGFDGVCVPLHARPDNLAAVVAGLRALENLGGFVVTMPHKSAILALVDEVSPVAQKIGAANVVRRKPDGRLVADMLDGEGFVRGLREAGIDPAGKSAYLAGAGGAANAIGFALAQAGVSRLTIANRTTAKAEDLKARILSLHPQARIDIGGPDPAGHDLVVNGTSLGMKENDPLPLDASRLAPDQIVCEVIMQPQDTPLLRAAQARGCRIHYGAPMLACQIALMAETMGVKPRDASGTAR
ncbi:MULTISPECIES: shikimate dehydrogenase [unclassified Achromobacter]|uniref:shikimate dehydrogenase family protein n=1 Tax=unclassified Achromobacter TaxID=2626865 RepID=UPI00069DC16A|nr:MULTISPECIES: shikimate dehydrogenase [unclassified Achromobacter]KOF54426.1 shikimate dehydrogenase [Achromobacter sp. DMS1]KOF54997.1 shikimate dehydrogenase [Achromobacter sp. DMS1]